jgi:hypothetical protein
MIFRKKLIIIIIIESVVPLGTASVATDTGVSGSLPGATRFSE